MCDTWPKREKERERERLIRLKGNRATKLKDAKATAWSRMFTIHKRIGGNGNEIRVDT